MINLTINNKKISVPKGTTVLDAAKEVNIDIPTLCHYEFPGMEKINRVASCRVCVVEIEGRRNLAPACATLAAEGMVVKTNTPRAIKARRTNVELLLSNHPNDCLICPKNNDCQLQKIAADLNVRKIQYKGAVSTYEKDTSSFSLIRDQSKCIMCRRCEVVCNEIQTCNILSAVGRGFDVVVSTAYHLPQNKTACTFCGLCVTACPTGALTEMSYIGEVWGAINHPTKKVAVQTAPAVRVALAEEFGLPAGEPVTGKLVTALKMLGFDAVFDTDFAADLTIMEEAHEIIERIKKNENLPILTSCCPGWVNFLEYQFPDLLNIPSTCKSPQQMFGAIAKTFYVEKIGIKPEDLTMVSIMPCLAKKYEARRDEFTRNNVPDVDYVITTRELIHMIKEAGIDFASLEDSEFDSPLGESTGAGVIFGASGGVLEAALRTVSFLLTGKNLDKIDFKEVRGLEGIKEAVVEIAGIKLDVVVTSGLGNARKILEKIQSGEKKYHAIEIMACPGGCVNGGGQPYKHGHMELVKQRMEGLYKEDGNKKIRRSHENPSIQKLYKDYLGEPGSHKAHELLHTHYTQKNLD